MKKGLLKTIGVTLMAGIMAFSLVGCGGSKEKTNKLDQIKSNGKIVVGLSADYAPYEFHAMIDGKDEVVGFDVDLAKEVAKDLGVELQIQQMDFDALIAALKSGQIDAIISGMNPTEERREQIDFSDIYYEAKHAVIAPKDEVGKYKTADDLNGKIVGAQLGSTQQQIAQNEIQAKDVTLLQDVNSLVLALKSKKVEAMITEKPVAEMIVKNNPEIGVTDIVFGGEGGGNAVGVQKDSPELVAEINTTIDRLKNSGDLDKYILEANDLAAKNQAENK